MIRSLHAWIVISSFWAAFAPQASAQPQDEVAVFFENKIRPILSRRCLECHGSKKAEGGLRLDTETGFKKGGESGAIVDVDDRLKSPILQAIRYEGLEMPPKEKLPEDEIELLEAWVKHGAYWPKHAAPLVLPWGRDNFRRRKEVIGSISLASRLGFPPLLACRRPTIPSTLSSFKPCPTKDYPWPREPMLVRWPAEPIWIWSAYLPREKNSRHSSTMLLLMPIPSWLIAFLRIPGMGKDGEDTGLTWCAMPNPTATSKMIFDRQPTVIATT